MAGHGEKLAAARKTDLGGGSRIEVLRWTIGGKERCTGRITT
jgi:hypothetical protein